jgi:hypothetical protein
LSEAELNRKFDALAEGVVAEAQRDAIRAALWGLEAVGDVNAVVDLLVWS